MSVKHPDAPAPTTPLDGIAVITLSRPLKAIDKTFTELRLREPTGEDLSQSDFPVRFSDKGGSEVIAPAMTRLIGILASIPPDSAKALSARDWFKCATAILSFLGNGAAASS